MDLLFGHGAAWFGVPAVLGTFFFLLRLGLMMMGGDGDMDTDIDADVDVDMDMDVDADVDADAHHGLDATDAFQVLSFQTVATFLMGFGWAGLGGLRGAGWSAGMSVLFGLAAGSGMVWILAKLLKLVYGFQSSGTVSIRDALGTEGQVYFQIPGNREGRGQVRLVIGDRQRYFNAVTDDEAIESKSRVRVVGINDDNTVTVSKT
jgi:hypothetical protein